MSEKAQLSTKTPPIALSFVPVLSWALLNRIPIWARLARLWVARSKEGKTNINSFHFFNLHTYEWTFCDHFFLQISNSRHPSQLLDIQSGLPRVLISLWGLSMSQSSDRKLLTCANSWKAKAFCSNDLLEATFPCSCLVTEWNNVELSTVVSHDHTIFLNTIRNDENIQVARLQQEVCVLHGDTSRKEPWCMQTVLVNSRILRNLKLLRWICLLLARINSKMKYRAKQRCELIFPEQMLDPHKRKKEMCSSELLCRPEQEGLFYGCNNLSRQMTELHATLINSFLGKTFGWLRCNSDSCWPNRCFASPRIKVWRSRRNNAKRCQPQNPYFCLVHMLGKERNLIPHSLNLQSSLK